jgi:hypothetical protein
MLAGKNKYKQGMAIEDLAMLLHTVPARILGNRNKNTGLNINL